MKNSAVCRNCGIPLIPDEKEISDLCYDCKKVEDSAGICAICFAGAIILVLLVLFWHGGTWVLEYLKAISS